MLSTTNQHQSNFWFATNPLPSFFDKNLYFQQQPIGNKFSSNSSNSENSPDYLLTRPTTFNYIQQNHHPVSNNFLSRDDWSQPSPNSTTWNKGKQKQIISLPLTSDY
jgi:hypothetical protein